MKDKDWQAEITLLQERETKARCILGVAEAAGPTEIRQAFRRLSLRHHPDVNGDDEDAARRFHLVCCGYKYLTEGEWCSALDELEDPAEPPPRGKYRQDNPWGYWCWWREQYFGEDQEER